jgi:hypothetical protein
MKRRISRAALVSSRSHSATKSSRSDVSTRIANWLAFLPAFFFRSLFLGLSFAMKRCPSLEYV